MVRLLVVVLMLSVLKLSCASPAAPPARTRRGYNSGYGSSGYGSSSHGSSGHGGSGYGHGFDDSDERDASVSGEGCGSGEDGRSYGSREYLRERESRQPGDRHRAHGYTRDPTSAVAARSEWSHDTS